MTLHRCLQALVLSMTLAATASAAEPRLESGSVHIENGNLSGKALLAALTGASLSERRHAKMYVVGVLDATERIAWCDYKALDTAALQEAVYTGLKGLSQGELEKRASTLIAGILHQRYPCWGKR